MFTGLAKQLSPAFGCRPDRLHCTYSVSAADLLGSRAVGQRLKWADRAIAASAAAFNTTAAAHVDDDGMISLHRGGRASDHIVADHEERNEESLPGAHPGAREQSAHALPPHDSSEAVKRAAVQRHGVARLEDEPIAHHAERLAGDVGCNAVDLHRRMSDAMLEPFGPIATEVRYTIAYIGTAYEVEKAEELGAEKASPHTSIERHEASLSNDACETMEWTSELTPPYIGAAANEGHIKRI